MATRNCRAIPADVIREAVRTAVPLSEDQDYARFDFVYNGNALNSGEVTCHQSLGLSNAPHPTTKLGQTTLANDVWELRHRRFLTSKQTGFAALYASALKRALD